MRIAILVGLALMLGGCDAIGMDARSRTCESGAHDSPESLRQLLAGTWVSSEGVRIADPRGTFALRDMRNRFFKNGTSQSEATMLIEAGDAGRDVAYDVTTESIWRAHGGMVRLDITDVQLTYRPTGDENLDARFGSDEAADAWRDALLSAPPENLAIQFKPDCNGATFEDQTTGVATDYTRQE